MSIINWRAGINDDPSTKITIWFKADGVGPYNVKIGGVGPNVDSTGPDNTATHTREDLEPDTEYEIRIGGTHRGYVKTFPAPGSAVRIMGTNCTNKAVNFNIGKIVTDRDPALFMWQGDNGYSGALSRYRDEDDNPIVTIDCDIPVNASTPVPRAAWYEHYKQFGSVPGVKRVNSRVPNVMLLSNHDRGGGIDDGSQYSYYRNGDTPMINQDTANNCWTEARAAFTTYRPDPPYATPPGSPPGTDNDIGEWHAEGGTAQADYDPLYYSFVCGCVEVFVMDAISGKGKNQQADATNYMFGPEQESWLIAGVNGSSQPWKMIVLAYGLTITYPQIANSAWSNGWHYRQTQIRRIIDAFNAQNTTGIFWPGADWHAPSLMVGEAPYKYASSNMGPGSILHNVAPEWVTVAADGDLYYGGETQNSPLNQSNVGQYDFTPTRLVLRGINVRGEQTIYAPMNQTENVFEEGSIQTIVHPVTYDHTISNYLHVGRDDVVGSQYFTDEITATVHGWGAPPGTGTYDMGACFQTNLPAGLDIRSAVLEVEIILDVTGVYDGLRILMQEPGAATVGPYDASNLPRDIDKSTPWQPIENWPLFFPSIHRINVTSTIQAALKHGSYTAGHFFNFNLMFLNGNDEVQIAALNSVGSSSGKPPRLVIQAID